VKNGLIWWFRHVERRFIYFVVRRVDKMKDSQITIGIGRPKKNYQSN